MDSIRPELASSVLQVVLVVVFAPGLQGLIKRAKAVWQGRRGPPLLQPYADLWKLLRKEPLVPAPA